MVPGYPLIRRLLDDLTLRPAYVMNLSWDIIAWNPAADRLFTLAERQPEQRNMLWMLFADPELNQRLIGWLEQAPQILASFRRDYARAPQDATMLQRIQALSDVSPNFASCGNSTIFMAAARATHFPGCRGRRSDV